ncbi:Hsc70-interacting protein 1-like protein [Leptotrombidium deliense]|uniref:Hsc70-interacting protein 1-like protein n=1 Tax=Leptotrombidium deliense TaxID=299467 RepID=A0A443RV77_9ACAR|nr:Hsc70-interacting protein 1-like protein [Leptotrombidium deliense]
MCSAAKRIRLQSPLESAMDLLEEGIAEAGCERYDEAVRKFTAALELQPQMDLFFRLRSECHFKLQNYPAAHRDADRSVGMNPDKIEGYALQAQCFLVNGIYTPLEELCKKFRNDYSMKWKYLNVLTHTDTAKYCIGKLKDYDAKLQRPNLKPAERMKGLAKCVQKCNRLLEISPSSEKIRLKLIV